MVTTVTNRDMRGGSSKSQKEGEEPESQSQRNRKRTNKGVYCWGKGRFAHYVMEDVFEVLVFVSRCEAKGKTNRYHGKQRQRTFYAGDIDQHLGLSSSMSSVY